MNLAKTLRAGPMRALLLIVIAAALLVPLVLLFGVVDLDVRGPSVVTGLLLSALIGVVLALVADVLLEAKAQASPMSEQMRRHEMGGAPVAISDLSGRLVWSNSKMKRLVGQERWIAEGLGRLFEVDAAEIYRAIRQAETWGLGLVLLPRRRVAGHSYFLVRQDDYQRLVWSSVRDEDLAEIMSSGLPLAWDIAPFARFRVEAGAVKSANRMFQNHFGADTESVLKAILQDGVPMGGRLLLPDASGRTLLHHVVVCDVTETLGSAQDVLFFPLPDAELSQDEPSAGLDQVPVALVQLDLKGRVLWQNKLARGMLAQHLDQGASINDVFESLGPPLRSLIDAVVSGAQQTRGEMMRLRQSEHEVFMELELSKVEIEGQETLFAVLTDASELRLLEDKFAQSQKMEAVGKLAGGVAHDFNNVLTAISGHCDLMMLGKDASHPDYSDLVQVRQNANRAAGLVRQLLAFSRKQTLNPVILNVEDVVSDTLYLLDRLIGEKVNLVVEHGCEIAPVRADRQQIEQALLNLVVNARDAMPEGGNVTLSTSNRYLPTNRLISNVEIAAGAYVEIAVRDEGTGIDQADLTKVFDPFFTTKAQGEGTGLGLSTVYGIVKQSGGSIIAENREGGGAVFRILLPQAIREAEEAETVEEEEGAKTGRTDPTGQGAVLLVEDETPVRAFATRALNLRGYAVTGADSAEAAMEILADPEYQVDLIITDVVMPGMDGPSFATEALKLRPGVKVIFVSGYAEEIFRKNAPDQDFRFLPKPFSLAELTAAVKEVLGAP